MIDYKKKKKTIWKYHWIFMISYRIPQNEIALISGLDQQE